MLNTRAAAYHKPSPVAEIGSLHCQLAKRYVNVVLLPSYNTSQVIKKEDDSSVNGAVATKGETKHVNLTFRSTLPVTLHNALRLIVLASPPNLPQNVLVLATAKVRTWFVPVFPNLFAAHFIRLPVI